MESNEIIKENYETQDTEASEAKMAIFVFNATDIQFHYTCNAIFGSLAAY